MSGSKKQAASVGEIMRDLKRLNATEFESVAHALLRAVEGLPLAQRGITVTGNPSGYSVDTLSLGGTVVAEYGTAPDYFDAPYEKPVKDVQHAIKLAAGVCRIHLMSNRECPNSDLPRVQASAAQAAPTLEGECVQVWSCREIADELYRRFVASGAEAGDLLTGLLPEFARLLDHEAYELAAPSLPARYVRDDAATDRLSQSLVQSRAVQLVGVSGVGKTMLAADWARRQKSGPVLWVASRDLPPACNLRGIRAERLGVRLNLAARVNKPGSVLVVDDFQGDLEQLVTQWEQHAGADARLLVTTQVQGQVLPSVWLEGVSRDVARRILPHGLRDGVFDRVFKATGGVPLALALCRGLVESGELDDVNDLESLAEEIPSEDAPSGGTVSQAILGRHLGAIGSELAILRWTGSQLHAEEFLRELLGPAGLRRVKRRAILQQEAPSVATADKVGSHFHRCHRYPGDHFGGGGRTGAERRAA